MRHCCKFKADDIYYLEETEIFSNRILSIGFCPICQKPVAELVEQSFSGVVNRVNVSGINANNMVLNLKDSVKYSVRELNYKKSKAKPYGWKYGVNKQGKNEKVRQYACDFYGNKELIKEFIK